MKVSVITVAYNSVQTIEDTMMSVLNQTHGDLEYILVDGGSADGTVELIRKHEQKISKWVSESDGGIYFAMNKGIEMASGDVVGILNSDDIYTDNRVIEEVISVFQTTNADIVYANLDYVERDNLNSIVRRWRAGKYKEGRFLMGWMPPHPTFFIRLEYYRKWGGYRTELRSSADYELMLRMIHKHHLNVAYLDRCIIKMRQGGQSNLSLKNRMKANKEDRLSWKLNGIQPFFFTTLLKPLRKISQFLMRS
jgi:glycosyltransferase involved in cell wall biosynthesis